MKLRDIIPDTLHHLPRIRNRTRTAPSAMARRSSARLRSQNSTTPKRVSLSHDAQPTRTPRTVPARLASVQESEDMPGAFPQSASPKSTFALYPVIPRKLTQTATPTKAAPIRPADSEMHPQLHHQSTAKPREEARHLGFSNMAPHTEPPKHTSKVAVLQATPTKSRNPEEEAKKSFPFSFRREHSLELSPEAKKLMYESREEAARIREQMIADGEAAPSLNEVLAARKIAKPKGRYSQVHLKEFEKMDSIASHPSVTRHRLPAQAGQDQTPRKDVGTPAKSLKRSPSKAGFFDQASTPSRPSSRDDSKPLPAVPGSSRLPRTTSFKDLHKATAVQPVSPAKRVKRAVADDVSAHRPGSSDSEKPLPATPQTNKQVQRAPGGQGGLTTPTQASLARAVSTKPTNTTKIPAPSFTPAKVPGTSIQKQAVMFETTQASPALLARSPSKAALFAKPFDTAKSNTTTTTSPLLARSPVKSGGLKKASEAGEEIESTPKSKAPPLLARSPLKAPVANSAGPDVAQAPKTPSIPFLARSPTKIPIAPNASDSAESPGQSTSNKLLGRFNLLRRSPIKSILRSPQRLYSDDPAKVAAGTHLATPEKQAIDASTALPNALSSASMRKHVDFTSSTKARDVKANSSTPSTTPTPSPNRDSTRDAMAEPASVSYPDLSADAAILSPSPQKRRQTSGPQDFTFRAGHQALIFGQSPNAPASAQQGNRRSTIRMVTSDLVPSPAAVVGSKKRKFEFENNSAAAKSNVVLEKENTPTMEPDAQEERRPAKRAKPSTASSPAAKNTAGNAKAPPTTKRTTLGVKPKGAKSSKATSPVKRSSTISQARLAALSQPKRRG